jgi:hypothetical protein
MPSTHIIRCIVTHEMDTGIPADRAVNVFHFGSGSSAPSGTDLTNLTNALNTFWNGTSTGSSAAVYSFMASVLAGSGTYSYYDLFDPEPRAPLRVDPFTGFTTGSTTFPEEVALVLSYQAQKLSGFDQASRRGRLFLGPLSTNAGSTASGRPVTTANGIVDTWCAAASGLLVATSAAGQKWQVYSRKFDTSADVHDGWCDDAFDTQRRRGVAPTARQLWT